MQQALTRQEDHPYANMSRVHRTAAQKKMHCSLAASPPFASLFSLFLSSLSLFLSFFLFLPPHRRVTTESPWYQQECLLYSHPTIFARCKFLIARECCELWLDLTPDGLIKLYALVESGITNGLDIDVVKVSNFFNVRISHVLNRTAGNLACSACHFKFVSRSLMQSLFNRALWVPTLILNVLSGIHS